MKDIYLTNEGESKMQFVSLGSLSGERRIFLRYEGVLYRYLHTCARYHYWLELIHVKNGLPVKLFVGFPSLNNPSGWDSKLKKERR